MLQRIISITLSLLFVLFLTAPTIIMMIDKTADVTIFYTSNEDEEKNGQEKDIDKKIVVNQYLQGDSDFDLKPIMNYLDYFPKNYSNPFINIISPPPELQLTTFNV